MLEDHDQYSHIATDSFFLQIKSKKSNNITYKPDEIKWLFDLELPFFIGRVDRSKQSIDLYCCHRISEAYLGNKDRQEDLIINFEDYDVNDHIITGNTVSVGPPVLSICLSECQLEEKREEFIKLCKSHIISENFNLQHRQLGVIHSLTWRKGSEIETNAALPFKLATKEKTQGVPNISNPYIVSLVSESLNSWDTSVLEKVINELEVVRDYIINSEKEETVFESKLYKLSKGDEVTKDKFNVYSCDDGDSVTPFNAKEFFSGNKDNN